MNIQASLRSAWLCRLVMLGLVFGGRVLWGSEDPEAPAAPSALPPPEVVIPKSVFVADDLQGRDPFFPKSVRRREQQEPASTEPVVLAVGDLLQLRGLTGPPTNRVALINTTPLKEGETGDVKVDERRRVRLQLLRITETSAVVRLEGQSEERELKLLDR